MDRRDYMAEFGRLMPSGMRYDARKKTLTIMLSCTDEEMDAGEGDEKPFTFPAKMEVCSTCNGQGKHVNPSIDAHGISPEEFRDDPDFEEAYFSGRYDIVCNECNGERIVPEIDEVRANKEDLKRFHKWAREKTEYRSICRAERNAERGFGC